jgi:truncated hemoglobin YjbI
MSDEKKTLYERLGGYGAIAAVANDLLPRLQADPQLGRFWAHRGEDGVKREKQLLIDFLCASAGGPVYYRGRDMALCHRRMRISESFSRKRSWNSVAGTSRPPTQRTPPLRARPAAFVRDQPGA